jgi:O-antigen ligase
MVIIFIGMIIYYVYWSNSAYFNYETWRFNNGRLPGPRFSPYNDENHFGILFVVGMPFLLFGFFYFKNLIIKLILGVALLFLWHSIILTGSRGALLAVGVSTLFASRLIKSKLLGGLLICGFVAAIIYQGGQLLERTQNTITAAQENNEEEKLDPRLQSWEVGLGLISKYPIFGVGVQRFQQATKAHYPGYITYVAHNTFLNFAANTGLINGLIYLYFLYMHFKNFRFARKHNIQANKTLDYANNAIMTALIGFYAGSMFLDLIIYQGFYFLLLLGLAKDFAFRANLKKELKKQDDGNAHV